MNLVNTVKKIRACNGDTAAQLLIEQLIEEAKKNERKKMWEAINAQVNFEQKRLPIHKITDQELLELIHKDLKMRADFEGVVNISDFIWQKLCKRLKKS